MIHQKMKQGKLVQNNSTTVETKAGRVLKIWYVIEAVLVMVVAVIASFVAYDVLGKSANVVVVVIAFAYFVWFIIRTAQYRHDRIFTEIAEDIRAIRRTEEMEAERMENAQRIAEQIETLSKKVTTIDAIQKVKAVQISEEGANGSIPIPIANDDILESRLDNGYSVLPLENEDTQRFQDVLQEDNQHAKDIDIVSYLDRTASKSEMTTTSNDLNIVEDIFSEKKTREIKVAGRRRNQRTDSVYLDNHGNEKKPAMPTDNAIIIRSYPSDKEENTSQKFSHRRRRSGEISTIVQEENLETMDILVSIRKFKRKRAYS